MADTVVFTIRVDDQATAALKNVEIEMERLAKHAVIISSAFRDMKQIVDQLSKEFKVLFDATAQGVTVFAKFSEVGSAVLHAIISPFSLLKDIIGGVIDVISGVIGKLGDLGETVLEFSVDAVKRFLDFEAAMIRVRQTAFSGMGLEESRKATEDLGGALREAALDMSEMGLQGGIAAIELAKISGVAGQLGIKGTENIINFTASVAKISVAFGMSAAKTAESLAILKNEMNLTVADVDKLASAVTQMAFSTAASADQIMQAVSRFGGVAEVFGLTADQAIALAATLKDVGITTSVTGTSMSRILTDIMQEYEKYAQVLGLNAASLKVALDSNNPSEGLFMVLQAFQNLSGWMSKTDMFTKLDELGIRNVRMADAFIKLASNIDKARVNMANSREAYEQGKAAQEAYNAAIDNSGAAFRRFQTFLQEVYYTIGGPLALGMEILLNEYLTPLVEKFEKWLNEPEILTTLNTAIPAAFKFIGEAIRDILTYFGQWIDYIIKSKDPAAAWGLFMEDLWRRVQLHGGHAWEWIKEKFLDLMVYLNTNFPGLYKMIQRAMQFFYNWGVNVENVKTKLKEFFTSIQTGWETFQRVMKKVEELLPGIEKALTLLGKTAGFTFTKMGEWASNAAEVISKMFTAAFNAINAAIDKVSDALVGLAERLIDVVKWVVQLDEDATKESTFPDMLRSIIENNTALTTMAENVGNVTEAVKHLGESPLVTAGTLFGRGPTAGNMEGYQYTNVGTLFGGAHNLPGVDIFGARPQAVPFPNLLPQTPAGVVPATVNNNITLTGTTIMDDRTLDRFVARITDIQERQAGRVLGSA